MLENGEKNGNVTVTFHFFHIDFPFSLQKLTLRILSQQHLLGTRHALMQIIIIIKKIKTDDDALQFLME